MNDADRERLGKVLAGRMSVDEFQAIVRREIQSALATLRAKVNRNSETERTRENHV